MVCRTRGRDHASTDMLGKLDGKARDTPRPALDQDGLAALQLQRILDRTQGREAGEGERGSVVMGQVARLLGNDRSLHGDLLRVGALLTSFADAEDCIANREILDAFAYGADHPGKIAPWDQWKLRMLVFAEAHLPIRRVDARGENIDGNVARTSHRIGKLAVLEHVRSAILLNERCLHLAPILSIPGSL